MKYARFWEGLDHAEEVLKLSNKNQELHLQYNKLIDNVNKLFDERETCASNELPKDIE